MTIRGFSLITATATLIIIITFILGAKFWIYRVKVLPNNGIGIEIADSLANADNFHLDTVQLMKVLGRPQKVYQEFSDRDADSSAQIWIYPVDVRSSFQTIIFRDLVAHVSGSRVDSLYIVVTQD